MRVTLFDSEGSDRQTSLAELSRESLTDQQILWVDLDREKYRDDTELVTWLGISSLGLPPRSQEIPRPRLDNFGDWIKARIITISSEQINLPLYFLVGRNWIVTVHDGPNELIDNFSRQIHADSRLGVLTGAVVFAALLDWHLTGIFRAIESLEVQVDSWDDRAMSASVGRPILPQLRQLRQRTARLRRTLVPHREVYAALVRPDIASVFGAGPDDVFTNLLSQMERAVDSVDNARELVLGSFEMYSAQVSQRTNDTMRLLTVVTVLLLPIGTLAGILGMNFQARFFATKDTGFWVALSFMLTFFISGIVYTYRQGWLRP